MIFKYLLYLPKRKRYLCLLLTVVNRKFLVKSKVQQSRMCIYVFPQRGLPSTALSQTRGESRWRLDRRSHEAGLSESRKCFSLQMRVKLVKCSQYCWAFCYSVFSDLTSLFLKPGILVILLKMHCLLIDTPV